MDERFSWDDWTPGTMTDDEMEVEILTMLNTNCVPLDRALQILENAGNQYAKAATEKFN